MVDSQGAAPGRPGRLQRVRAVCPQQAAFKHHRGTPRPVRHPKQCPFVCCQASYEVPGPGEGMACGGVLGLTARVRVVGGDVGWPLVGGTGCQGRRGRLRLRLWCQRGGSGGQQAGGCQVAGGGRATGRHGAGTVCVWRLRGSCHRKRGGARHAAAGWAGLTWQWSGRATRQAFVSCGCRWACGPPLTAGVRPYRAEGGHQACRVGSL
jgi:hypothetical protein